MNFRTLLKINLSWVNTSISMGFRVIEIPFILSFLSVSPVSGDISLFGIVLSIIVASSGFLLSLATPTSCGEDPRRTRILLLWTTGIAYLFANLLLVVFLWYDPAVLRLYPLPYLSGLILFALLTVGIRRVYQGALIYLDRSWVILFSSIVRIAFTIGMSLGLTDPPSYFWVALWILLLGALVDTSFNQLLYWFYSKKQVVYRQTNLTSLKNYLMISTPSLVYTTQNYLVIIIVTWIHDTSSIDDWVILYSFISIFMGIFVDIENITAKFKLTLNKIHQILALPLMVGVVLLALLLFFETGRRKYFIDFQGISDLKNITEVRGLVIAIVMVFLVKQFFKGILIFKNKNLILSISGYANVVGLILAGIVGYQASPPHLIYTASCIFLAGLIFEFLFICYGYHTVKP